MSESMVAEQQADRIKAAVDGVIAIGPGFLRGEITVDAMTEAMVGAVRDYEMDERAQGRDGSPLGPGSAQLMPVLQELITCGGGYRAGRCDAACVARTMTYLVGEYGTR